MIKIPRIAWIIGILAVVAVVGLAALPAHVWDEYAPEATIHCSIKAVGTYEQYAGSVNVGDESMLQALTASNPMTAFTSDVGGIDANTVYVINFTAVVTAKSALPGEALTTYVNVTGIAGNMLRYYYGGTNTALSVSMPQVAGETATFNTGGFTHYLYLGVQTLITGDVIHNSQFDFVITSIAADGRTSSTTATLTINVTDGGTIYLNVDDITTSVG